MMDLDKFIFGADNLFKFLSLSGLVIVAFALLYPIKMERELEFDLIEIQKQQKIFNKEVDNLKVKIVEIQKDTAKSKNEVRALVRERDSALNHSKINSLASVKNFYTSRKEEIKSTLGKKIDGLNEIVLKQSIKSIEIESAEAKITVAKGYIESYKLWFYILMAAGGIMSLYGFIRWHKSQNLAEKMQQTELDLAKKELNKP